MTYVFHLTKETIFGSASSSQTASHEETTGQWMLDISFEQQHDWLISWVEKANGAFLFVWSLSLDIREALPNKGLLIPSLTAEN
jgi:hypothetical protein